MKRYQSEKGSALVAAVIFALIFSFAIGALLTTAYNEHRSANNAYLNTSAFCLAESGVDFAAEAVAANAFPSPAWTSTANGYVHVSGALGNGGYRVVCKSTSTGWEIRSLGNAQNTGAGLASSRAVMAVFSASSGGSLGNALVAREGITLGNNTTGNNQGYVRVASYKSSNGAPQWGGNNFGRNALVGVISNKSGTLAINAATIYGSLAIGGENSSTVFSNSRAKNLTASQTDSSSNVDASKYVKDFTYPFTAPQVPAVDQSWTVVTPADTVDGSTQYKYSGKLTELPKSVTAATYSSGTLSVGSTGNNTLILGSSCDNVSTINVSGNVVLYFTQNANLNNTVVHLNDGASLQLYFCSGVSSIPTTDNTNFNPSRYQINVLPNNSAPNLTGTSASDIINGVLNSAINTAASASNVSAASIVVNYGSKGILTAMINAPFSNVQMSTGNSLGACQMRGSIIARSITTTGGDFLDFYYDEDSKGNGSATARLTGWREIRPSDVPSS